MELKDVILSTLAEMEDSPLKPEPELKQVTPVKAPKEMPKEEIIEEPEQSSSESELMYLNSIKERILVLFEGFQAPNNTNIEAKVDMTLNFLEYTLATISARVETLEKGK